MDKSDEISEEDLSKLRFIVNAATSTGCKNILMLTEEMLVLITEIERLRAENALLKIVADGYDECAQELRETALENNRLAAASSASAAKQQTISEILQRVEEQQARIEHAYRHAIAERDRLAALVEKAVKFHLDEYWILVRTCRSGEFEWLLCRGNTEHFYPDREAAMAAYEAARAKEAAE